MSRTKDMVTVTCYGKRHSMERNKAIDFYTECACGSEGSERDRYINILMGLNEGLSDVSDEDVF